MDLFALAPSLSALPSLLPALLVFLLLLVYWYGTRTHGTLERLGLPVVRPYPFVGSLVALDGSEDMTNARRLGRVWGEYFGMTPTVVIADAELAKRVLIKDFDHFSDNIMVFDTPLGRDLLDCLQGERWKVVRALLAQGVTSSAKLKAMLPTMHECTEEAFQRVDAKLRGGPELSVKEDLFAPVVLDIGMRFSFGMRVPDVADASSAIVGAAGAFDAYFNDSGLSAVLSLVCPPYARWSGTRVLDPPLRFFVELLRRSIRQRRAEGVVRPDLASVIADAIDNKLATEEFRRLDITEDLLLLQGAGTLMGAYNTTGTALAEVAFQLAHHPTILERVTREVAAAGKLTYDTLHKLPLLEAVIREALRLKTILPRITRRCSSDWQHDGVHVPAGLVVHVPLRVFHDDPAVFPAPNRFQPDRWLAESARARTQYSFLPFGLGPRACLGARLAMIQCKFVLAELVRRYRLAPPAGTAAVTEGDPMPQSGFGPVFVRLEKRESVE